MRLACWSLSTTANDQIIRLLDRTAGKKKGKGRGKKKETHPSATLSVICIHLVFEMSTQRAAAADREGSVCSVGHGWLPAEQEGTMARGSC